MEFPGETYGKTMKAKVFVHPNKSYGFKEFIYCRFLRVRGARGDVFVAWKGRYTHHARF